MTKIISFIFVVSLFSAAVIDKKSNERTPLNVSENSVTLLEANKS